MADLNLQTQIPSEIRLDGLDNYRAYMNSHRMFIEPLLESMLKQKQKELEEKEDACHSK